MAEESLDSKVVLERMESLLGKDGELRSLEEVPQMFSLMKASTTMASMSVCLNVLLQTQSNDILQRFIKVGGFQLLSSWLTHSESTNNTPLLQLILLTLQKLPLKVKHLTQNNAAKFVKQLSKSGETEDVRKLAGALVDGWLATISAHCASKRSSSNSPGDKKRKQGLEMEDTNPTPPKKKTPAPQLGEKSILKWPQLKRPSSGPSDDAPPEKKHKPLNTPWSSNEGIEAEITPAQPEEPNTPTNNGKKKKKVQWAEEEQLTQFFYFELDRTERGEGFRWRFQYHVVLGNWIDIP
ncbi:serine/threonine-protein phosphatase 1 regulatory subunit 10-like [Cyprinodon tularosa]|uniref:serine/threonine-protein phosphatase 1 regulatory subunit 10-like n=1 Tax=Cyprinodon tularosa TaxID=77115 RepID=UPI0018E271C3|nr:serine/threonine-protein phosphatase 1 regulatory subunit 10-like [Cyprinodon tularosa]XP_038135663.1 serine/threonine-protein phosphatase 1 regulatory subunit 10-like [Cyprinodon tularosa]XP_038146371.1 serine/threonine-protein phosphatase 1 regulatory subunit 10-like [Cyprinodon tularosa]XP_038146372.1 serine/threonine-protein phosphatase 1 regulatory subunit 10-like [Cyprinodon tularosa]